MMENKKYEEYLINEVDDHLTLEERMCILKDEIQRMEINTINLRRELVILEKENKRRKNQ